jgi:hypothetical protein
MAETGIRSPIRMNPFFLKNTVIGPLELRPWTLTTQMAIMELGLAAMTDQEQVVACAWMQSREPEEVEQAISDKTATASIKAFSRAFPLALAKPVAEWCRAQAEAVETGRVEVIPQPGGRTDQPKN